MPLVNVSDTLCVGCLFVACGTYRQDNVVDLGHTVGDCQHVSLESHGKERSEGNENK